jgi:hypothetical protein
MRRSRGAASGSVYCVPEQDYVVLELIIGTVIQFLCVVIYLQCAQSVCG